MTGSASDPESFQPHIRNKAGRDMLAKRAKDGKGPLKLVIVRDMWLTGFDAPCMHTMYIDKPMQGHGLMQAIACVSRVFRNKPAGLIVDYLGIADSLKKALSNYTERDRAEAGVPQEELSPSCWRNMNSPSSYLSHDFDCLSAMRGSAVERLRVLPAAMEHILSQENGRDRFMKACLDLSKAFALAAASVEATEIRDEVGFFQNIRAAFANSTSGSGKSSEELGTAVLTIYSKHGLYRQGFCA